MPTPRQRRRHSPQRAGSVPLKGPPRDTARKSSKKRASSSGGGGATASTANLAGGTGADNASVSASSASATKDVFLKISREQRGLCGECGSRTHELKKDGATDFRSKEALTIEGKVRRGRCLACHPLPGGSANLGAASPLNLVTGGGRPQPQPQQQNPQPLPLTSVNIDERVERWRKHRRQQQQSQGGVGSQLQLDGSATATARPSLSRSSSSPRVVDGGISSFRSSSLSTINTVSTLGFDADPVVASANAALASPSGGVANANNADVRSVTSSSGVTIKRIRERRGLCAECGARTHEFAADGAKIPLTVDGEVRRGRCLHCHPLPNVAAACGAAETSPNATQQQQPPSSDFGPSQARARSNSEADSRGQVGGRPQRNARSSSEGNLREPLHPVGASDRRRSAENSGKRADSQDGGRGDRERGPRPWHGGGGVPGRRNSFCSTMSAVSSCDLESMESEHTSDSVRAKRAADAELVAAARLDRLGAAAGSDDLCDIIATMRQYPANPTIQERGCRKLWSQSQSKSNGTALGRAGGIPTVINAMRSHGHVRSLQLMGCEALQNLARHSEYNRRVIRDGGGVSAVLHGMRTHRGVLGVQVCGCAALAVIGELRRGVDGSGRGTGSGASGERMGEEVSVLCVLRGAIEAFPQEERVLRSAYKTLKALGFKPMEVLARWQEEKEGG